MVTILGDFERFSETKKLPFFLKNGYMIQFFHQVHSSILSKTLQFLAKYFGKIN
jgi:hypothetical protein